MSCKNCDRLEALTNEDILSSIKEQLSIEKDLATEELKEERLSICMDCPFFQDHTCTKCGCYALFRASLNQKSCPINKWESNKFSEKRDVI